MRTLEDQYEYLQSPPWFGSLPSRAILIFLLLYHRFPLCHSPGFCHFLATFQDHQLPKTSPHLLGNHQLWSYSLPNKIHPKVSVLTLSLWGTPKDRKLSAFFYKQGTSVPSSLFSTLTLIAPPTFPKPSASPRSTLCVFSLLPALNSYRYHLRPEPVWGFL